MGCQKTYIGKFCKSGTGGVVLGFVCVQNDVPKITYYDPLTGMPYVGAVDTNCSNVSVYSKYWNNKSGTTIVDSLFANAPKDPITNLHAITVVINGLVQHEGASIDGFSLSGNTITVTNTLTSGDNVSVYFVY